MLKNNLERKGNKTAPLSEESEPVFKKSSKFIRNTLTGSFDMKDSPLIKKRSTQKV